jgi:two-component system NtrC family sensor kinase
MSDENLGHRNVTARRLMLAFGAVLALFGAALTVELVTLGRIADAETDVARLDAAKYAGHMAAAQVREQYIHQAHTLIELGPGHLEHYGRVAAATRSSIEHLEAVAMTPDVRELARQIAALAAENDREFLRDVGTVIARGDRSSVAALGEQLESVVDRVVALNSQLNARLDGQSTGAREHADRLRDQAVIVTIACFALAIGLAMGVAWWLTRTITRRVEALRRGARRVGAGDLQSRIELAGNDEFTELATTFNHMAASLADNQVALIRSQKLASIGQVAAGVAHELNNPLSVIIGYTKLLRGESGPRGDELRIIDDEARLCQRIVAELLDLARPHRLEIEPVDLVTLAREAIDRLQDGGALRDRRIEMVDGGGPVVVAGDAGKLRQVISNVVMNAAEATDAAGTIRIDARDVGDQGTLMITDDGTGIAPGVRDQMFEPFITTKPTGTGLGLTIAQAIVDAHGGRIAVASSLDHGTCVTLHLPLVRPAASP